MYVLNINNRTNSPNHPPQIPILRHSYQQLMLDAFINLKLWISLQVFPNGSFRIVTGAPGAVGEHVGGHVFDDGVKDAAVTADASEWSVGMQLSQYMGVVGVEADQNSLVVLGDCFHLGNNFWRNARTLNHLDARCHGVGFDGGTVVGADFDNKHFAFGFFGVKQGARFNGGKQIKLRQHGTTEDLRTPMRDASFDD